MPWNEHNFPRSMKNLTTEVRNKAIEIANALLYEGQMPEGIAIATSISRAKDWAANRDIEIRANDDGKITDMKSHGQDQYVIPKNGRWAVKTEMEEDIKPFSHKPDAIKFAREKAKEANSALVIQRRDGKIQKRISYNPNKKKAKA